MSGRTINEQKKESSFASKAFGFVLSALPQDVKLMATGLYLLSKPVTQTKKQNNLTMVTNQPPRPKTAQSAIDDISAGRRSVGYTNNEVKRDSLAAVEIKKHIPKGTPDSVAHMVIKVAGVESTFGLNKNINTPNKGISGLFQSNVATENKFPGARSVNPAVAVPAYTRKAIDDIKWLNNNKYPVSAENLYSIHNNGRTGFKQDVADQEGYGKDAPKKSDYFYNLRKNGMDTKLHVPDDYKERDKTSYSTDRSKGKLPPVPYTTITKNGERTTHLYSVGSDEKGHYVYPSIVLDKQKGVFVDAPKTPVDNVRYRTIPVAVARSVAKQDSVNQHPVGKKYPYLGTIFK